MAEIYKQKMTVEMEGEFVVFIIGMRVNKPWKVHKWWPAFIAMPRMLKELSASSDLGLLGYRLVNLFTVVQYWRSFEHLEAFARSREHTHLPAWREFNQKIRHGSGDVGLWHETYRIQPGCYEVVYSGMPAFGLGQVGKLVPVAGYRDSARGRLEQAEKQPEVGMV